MVICFELFLVYFNPATDLVSPYLWMYRPLMAECIVYGDASSVSHCFRVEEAEVVSPDGQIYNYPVLCPL